MAECHTGTVNERHNFGVPKSAPTLVQQDEALSARVEGQDLADIGVSPNYRVPDCPATLPYPSVLSRRHQINIIRAVMRLESAATPYFIVIPVSKATIALKEAIDQRLLHLTNVPMRR